MCSTPELEAERVQRLADAQEALRRIAEGSGSSGPRGFCRRCGKAAGHKPDCPTRIAREALETLAQSPGLAQEGHGGKREYRLNPRDLTQEEECHICCGPCQDPGRHYR